MKIALAQINPTVGDIIANTAKIRKFTYQAAREGAQLVIFPELALTGYPPKDLLLKPQFIDDSQTALTDLAQCCADCASLVGLPCRHRGPTGRDLHNAVALLNNQKIESVYYKLLLPTYDVFDESRYFEPARSQQIVNFHGKKLGLTICEDIWAQSQPQSQHLLHPHSRNLYETKPLADLAAAGADIVINVSASPFVLGKHDFRCELFSRQCRHYQMPLLYVNQIGGNDELIFDGNSCAFDSDGTLIAQAKDFTEDLLIIDLDNPSSSRCESPRRDIESIQHALVLGLRDYVRKCRFQSVVLGLSGGIDSAVTAALAAQALGPENVTGVAMPSRYSSDHSLADAEQLAKNLGIGYLTIPIEPAHAALETMLAPAFAECSPDITEENLQARVRGNLLMALSNKFNHLVLTTGNKSELAVGYCTLYGDMAGGLALISDVPKTMVYQLARQINQDSLLSHNRELIPASTITKPPSAELRLDQVDQDSLPPYDELDEILQRYVEQEQSAARITAAGFDAQTVQRVINLVDHNEYKRKQAAPGLKVTSRAFGFGRRLPIAQNYQPYKKP
ncbi:MAG: NAD+ synthase [Sedimentisphaerales bacterium]|nr:NAD+ synthase [Sedimentisphaerales bacterium]